MRTYGIAKAAVIVYNVGVHAVNKASERIFLLLASVLSKPKQRGIGTFTSDTERLGIKC